MLGTDARVLNEPRFDRLIEHAETELSILAVEILLVAACARSRDLVFSSAAAAFFLWYSLAEIGKITPGADKPSLVNGGVIARAWWVYQALSCRDVGFGVMEGDDGFKIDFGLMAAGMANGLEEDSAAYGE